MGKKINIKDTIDALNKKNIELSKLTEELKEERDRLHNALEELSEAKEFYRIMGEALPYGIWMCDAEGKARYMSQSFLDLLEMTLEQAQEFGWSHRLPPEDIEHMFEEWLDCVHTGKDWDSEHRILGPDGKYHTVLTRGKPVRDKEGKIISWVGINLDIDQRKEMEEEARQKEIEIASLKAHAYEEERKRAEALAELDRSKTIFFSNISHEFRTPLTLMLGPVEDLLNKNILPDKEKSQLKLVHRNTTRLLKLVNTLMDFSRIEAGRVQAAFEPVNLSAFTSDLVSLFRSAIEKAGLKLLVSTPSLSELVYVDRDMWEKIVFNLLSNAFKYTFQGEIEISLEQKNRNVQLKVRDTGIGISSEEIPHLFERFYRVNGAEGRSVEGTGIGLSLLYELVKIHSGSITAESTPGKGSTFIVELPFGKEHIPEEKIIKEKKSYSTSIGAGPFIEEALRWLPDEATEDTTNTSVTLAPGTSYLPPDETSLSKSTVLVVDDNADMRDYLKRLLSDKYNTITASNGREALEIINNNKPDIVLTDILMPEIDGMELLQYIRNNSETKTLPVIMLTARAGEESRVEVFEAGADAYLVKPFSARELLTYVKAYLEMSRLRAKAAVNEELAHKEKALREAQEHYHTLFNVIDEGFCIIEVLFDENQKPVDYRFLEINPAFEKQTGLINAHGRRVRELAPELEEYWFEIYGSVAVTGKPARVQNRAEQFNRWYDLYTFSVGPIEEHKVAVLFNDITERKLAEEKLRIREAQLDAFFANSPAILNLVDGNFCYINTDNLTPTYYGLNRESIKGKCVQDLSRDFFETTGGTMRRVIETGEPVLDALFASPLPGREGEIAYWRTSFFRVPMGDEKWGVGVISTEITDIKRSEKKFKESEERLKAIFDNLEEGLITFDPEGRMLDWNPAALKMHGYNYVESKVDFLSRVGEIFEPTTIDGKFLEFEQWPISRMMLGENFREYPMYLHNKEQGWKKLILYSGKLVHDSSGKPLIGFLSMRDITRQKKAEEALNDAYKNIEERLKEKEVLLREIYHRTKNTLQLISSMLSIRSSVIHNSEIQHIIEETQDRIRAIALVHEKLYKGNNLSRVNLKDYISSLARLLIDNHSMGNRISLKHDLEEVNLLIDSAIPCGLIITELIMNSVKHAFPGDMEGNIEIKLRRMEDRVIELIISDNGVGLKGSDKNSEGKLGLQLFQSIAEEQLDATVSLKADHGVEWSIRFTDSLYEERV